MISKRVSVEAVSVDDSLKEEREFMKEQHMKSKIEAYDAMAGKSRNKRGRGFESISV